MKRLTNILCVAAAGYLLTGCSLDYTYTEQDLRNDYLVNWIKTYGLIDPEQDWNMARSVEMPVNPDDYGMGSGALICIYTDDPAAGGTLIGRTSTPQILRMDVVRGTTTLYVRAYNSTRTKYINAEATITDGVARITGLSRALNDAEATVASRAGEGQTRTDYNWILACEDLGTLGDTDFNDIVLGMTYVAGETTLTITPLAAGGTLEAYVRFDGTELGEIHKQFNVSTTTMHNTVEWHGPGTPWEVTVPANFSITDRMGRVSLKIIRGDGDKIASTIIESPDDMGQAPSIICVPGDWEWPTEGTSIHMAYEGFTSWSKDHTNSDWVNGSTATADKRVDRPEIQREQLYRRTLTIDGVTREYMLWVPNQVKSTTALIVSLHGASNRATDYMPIKYDAEVPDADYIIAYPQGLDQDFGPFGTVAGWDAIRTENINPWAPIQETADTKFLRALVADVHGTYSFDLNRVYCCGFSNGGMMAYAVAATLSDVFAACASIEGFPMNEFHLNTSGPRPVPFLHIHGVNDDFVPHALFPVIRDCMVARNGCNPVPTVTTLNDNGRKYTKRVYTAGSDGADYVTYEVKNLGHWYGDWNLEYGNTTRVMWDFLKGKRLNTSTNDLVWRFNIDAAGMENAAGYDTDHPDWDKWDYEVNADRTRFVIGHGQPEGATHNVYPAIQLVPGDYRIEYWTEGSGSDNVHIDLTNIADGNRKLHGSSQVGYQAYKTFHIFSYGNYKLTIVKDDADDVFTHIAIYRADNSDTSTNFTEDNW